MCAGGANCICGTDVSDLVQGPRTPGYTFPPQTKQLNEARIREIIREEVSTIMMELMHGH